MKEKFNMRKTLPLTVLAGISLSCADEPKPVPEERTYTREQCEYAMQDQVEKEERMYAPARNVFLENASNALGKVRFQIRKKGYEVALNFTDNYEGDKMVVTGVLGISPESCCNSNHFEVSGTVDEKGFVLAYYGGSFIDDYNGAGIQLFYPATLPKGFPTNLQTLNIPDIGALSKIAEAYADVLKQRDTIYDCEWGNETNPDRVDDCKKFYQENHITK
jgi:hypothetical protein